MNRSLQKLDQVLRDDGRSPTFSRGDVVSFIFRGDKENRKIQGIYMIKSGPSISQICAEGKVFNVSYVDVELVERR